MQHYESYKPSAIPWVSDLPQHWGEEKGKWLHRFRKDLNNRKQCNNVLSLTLRGVVNNDPDDPEGLVPKDYGTYQIFEKDDLVFKLIDLENFRTSRVGLVHERGIMSPAYLRVQPGRSHNPRYFYYYYFTLYQQGIYNKLGAGVRSTLGPTDLLEIGVPVPPREEQDRIVAFLDQKTAEIDAAIAKKERLIELLNEQRGVLIDNAVTRGDSFYAEVHPSKLLGIEFVPAHWQVLQLKRVVETKITDGPHETPIFVDEGVPFASVEAAFDGRIDLEKRRGNIDPKAHARYCQKLKPQRDDIFFVKSGSTTGKTVIVNFDDEFSVWSPLALIRPKRDFFKPRFLLSALQSPYFQRQVQTGWSYGTQPNIGMSDLEKLWVAMPPISEQVLILESLQPRLEKIDETISLIRRELAELQHWKNTLIAESVTGKIKV